MSNLVQFSSQAGFREGEQKKRKNPEFSLLIQNFSFRKICPVESYCVVTVGRVYPKINEEPPSISNTTTKEEAEKLMSKFEGKAFVKRDCLPINRIDQNGCKKFPSTEGLDPPFGKFKKSMFN